MWLKTPQSLWWKSRIFRNESACPRRKSLIFITISKLWLVYGTLSYFRSILGVLRNGLVQKFSNHLYLFLFCIIYYFNSSSARTNFIRLKLIWTCLWHAWTGRYTREELQTFYPSLLGEIIHFIAPWNNATILYHFENQNIWNKG